MLKRKKKTFPKGTFIPTPARVMAILHLCLAFTVLLWSGGYPFMGELYALKSKKLLHEQVIQSESFHHLPKSEQELITSGLEKIQSQSQIGFLTKCKRMTQILAFYLPSFMQAWLLFSLVIPILLLLRIEGAVLAAWLLPILVLFYAVHNQNYGKDLSLTQEMALFPTEEMLVSKYVEGKLDSRILAQHQQLKDAWEKYLIVEWAQERPSKVTARYKQQLDQGQLQFNIARIKAQEKDRISHYVEAFHKKESVFMLILYFAWNLFFAYFVNRVFRKETSLVTPLLAD